MCPQPTSRCSNVHPSAWRTIAIFLFAIFFCLLFLVLFAILALSCCLWLLITILNIFCRAHFAKQSPLQSFPFKAKNTPPKPPKPHPPFRICNMFRWTLSCLTTQSPWISSVALIAHISKRSWAGHEQGTTCTWRNPVLTTTQGRHPKDCPPDRTGCPQHDG